MTIRWKVLRTKIDENRSKKTVRVPVFYMDFGQICGECRRPHCFSTSGSIPNCHPKWSLFAALVRSNATINRVLNVCSCTPTVASENVNIRCGPSCSKKNTLQPENEDQRESLKKRWCVPSCDCTSTMKRRPERLRVEWSLEIFEV